MPVLSPTQVASAQTTDAFSCETGDMPHRQLVVKRQPGVGRGTSEACWVPTVEHQTFPMYINKTLSVGFPEKPERN